MILLNENIFFIPWAPLWPGKRAFYIRLLDIQGNPPTLPAPLRWRSLWPGHPICPDFLSTPRGSHHVSYRGRRIVICWCKNLESTLIPLLSPCQTFSPSCFFSATSTCKERWKAKPCVDLCSTCFCSDSASPFSPSSLFHPCPDHDPWGTK